jgi:signal transduction histidine kinase
LFDSSGKRTNFVSIQRDITERKRVAKELRRIGTNLHDGVGQELTGLLMIADTLSVALTRVPRPEAKIAEKIKAGLQRALNQVRALSRGMNPVDVDARGVMTALSEMSIQLQELTGIRCSFQCDQPVLLRDNKTATQLFRIAQEAAHHHQ